MEKHIISEEVIRARVPTPLKERVRQDARRGGSRTGGESAVIRNILCEHYGIDPASFDAPSQKAV